MGTGDAMDYHPIQKGVEIPLGASCYWNRDKLQPDRPLGSNADFGGEKAYNVKGVKKESLKKVRELIGDLGELNQYHLGLIEKLEKKKFGLKYFLWTSPRAWVNKAKISSFSLEFYSKAVVIDRYTLAWPHTELFVSHVWVVASDKFYLTLQWDYSELSVRRIPSGPTRFVHKL